MPNPNDLHIAMVLSVDFCNYGVPSKAKRQDHSSPLTLTMYTQPDIAQKFNLVAVLAILHFVNDGIGALFIANLSSQNIELGIQATMGYAVLAFGLQAPIGYWVDRGNQYRLALMIGICLMALFTMVYLLSGNQYLLVGLLGLSSAIFHTIGGALVLKTKTTAGLGLFSAPGVLGLAVGSFTEIQLLPYFALLWILLLGWIWWRNPIVTKEEAPPTHLPDQHDLVMLILLFGIALRSSVWNIFQAIAMGNTEGLLWMAVAAFIGKIIGSMITKRVDPMLYVCWVLPLSTLVLICQDRLDGLLYFGLALLQSATGPMLKLMYSAMPKQPAFASGLTLGTGILIGGLIYYLDIEALILSGYLVALLIGFICYAVWSTIKQKMI